MLVERDVNVPKLVERIARLRAEASALISEARDWEELLPYPPEHSCGPVCEDCRVKLSRETRDGYKW